MLTHKGFNNAAVGADGGWVHDEAHNYVTCSVVRVKNEHKHYIYTHIFLKYAQQKEQVAKAVVLGTGERLADV